MEREKSRSTVWDRDRTSDRDRVADDQDTRASREIERRAPASDRDTEMTRRYDDDRSSMGSGRREYGSTSILGRDPRLSPGFEMMRTMMREMMRPFGDILGHGSSPMMGIPPVEIFEQDGRMVVRADLPGMTRDDVKVRVVDDTLILEGERRNDRASREPNRRQGYYESEVSYGRFTRQIVLPGRIDPAQVRARFQHGVLEIEVSVDTPRAREVPIETERDTAASGGRSR